MATAAQILSDSCATDIGKETNPISLLKIIAQVEAEKLAAAVPGTSINADDILARACTSGIGKVENELQLLAIIAQLLNEQG